MPFVVAFLAVPDIIVRALFARGAFSADAANAAATLSAYALGLVPFVLIRSASASFYARQDTATPVKAALAGVAVIVALKIVLAGSLAQVGLALGTAAGAWVNLVLVVVFAVSAGHLQFDREMRLGLVKFATAGIALARRIAAGRRGFSAPFWLNCRRCVMRHACHIDSGRGGNLRCRDPASVWPPLAGRARPLIFGVKPRQSIGSIDGSC